MTRLNWQQLALSLAVLMCLAVGCGGGADGPFDPNAFVPGSRISAKTMWSASGEGLSDAHAAIDGNVGTAAQAPEGYQNAALTIDLGEQCFFNMIGIAHGQEEHGFAKVLAVLISSDGRTYTRLKLAPGQRDTTIISLIQPVLARYVRIEVVRPHWQAWSIAEVQLK